ncbi:MAG: tyrosine-type recombinase/integrase, partial [Ilumatobacteraceae bacterium]|nr:tyrosine-type recombinase/integrase [Ilumatobacteraceae bacterium]
MQWLDLVSAQFAATTVRAYQRLGATTLAPDLGHLALRRITTQRLDSYYAGLARDRGLSPATIRHHHAVLRGALGQAVRWGWIPTNPAAGASPPKIRRREITPPALDVTRQLLAAADDHTPEFGALLRVLAATGARRGEVCGLRWFDVDWHTNTLSINRSVASIAGGTIINDTKTHAARHVAIDSDTMRALAHQLERAQHCAVDCRFAFEDNSFVFTSTPDGGESQARHSHRSMPCAAGTLRPQRTCDCASVLSRRGYRTAMILVEVADEGPIILDPDGKLVRDALAVLKRHYEGSDSVKKTQRRAPLRPTIYAQASVRIALYEAFYDKCAYCESPALSSAPLDVDHFRPIAGAIGTDGAESREHYWWLTYSWSNLLLACSDCTRAKGNRFPVDGTRAKRDQDVASEQY